MYFRGRILCILEGKVRLLLAFSSSLCSIGNSTTYKSTPIILHLILNTVLLISIKMLSKYCILNSQSRLNLCDTMKFIFGNVYVYFKFLKISKRMLA